MNPLIILASASKARTKLLSDAGLQHQTLVTDVAEEQLTDAFLATNPSDFRPLVLELATAKARRGAQLQTASTDRPTLLIGCDSMAEFAGEIFGKPKSPELATKRWQRLRGNTLQLHTGHWVIHRDANGQVFEVGGVSTASVHFADISDAEVAAYVASGEPLWVAGGFTLDGLAAPFITGIEGDPSGIIGLSLPLLRNLLHDLGLSWPSLWNNIES